MVNQLIQEYHDACAKGDLRFIKRYTKEEIQEIYEENEDWLQNFHPKGLFWALLCGRFNIAKYLIKENIFDPNEMICGEIHILHILATMGGRITSVDTQCIYNQVHEKLFDYIVFKGKFTPEIIVEVDPEIYRIEYIEKDVLDFTNWLLDNYDINVSVLTKWKWYEVLRVGKSQSCAWFEFYRNIIFEVKKELKIKYECSVFTPFHYACLFGRKSFVELLVLRGCDLLCLGCKNICKKCPFYISSFFEECDPGDGGPELDNYLDVIFDISYNSHEIPPMSEYQIYLINDYLRSDVVLILMEEFRLIKPFSLKFDIIDKLATEIKRGKYIKNISQIPETLKKDIKFYINICYFKRQKNEISPSLC
tara:strand:- start:955 stop:2046 length:1092 start_codon:yes stop_codon:yes gene_type:complete